MLEKHCSPDSGKKVVRTRGKKIIPGKPILAEDLTPSTSGQSTSKVHAKKAKKTVESSKESISESDNAAESESNDDEANAGTGDRTDRGTTSDTTITVDQWVVVGYPGKRKNTQLMYVGQVTRVHGDNDNVDVTFVKKLSGTTDPIFTSYK